MVDYRARFIKGGPFASYSRPVGALGSTYTSEELLATRAAAAILTANAASGAPRPMRIGPAANNLSAKQRDQEDSTRRTMSTILFSTSSMPTTAVVDELARATRYARHSH